MFTLFVEGGWAFMSVLTAILAAVFFAAWKAPRWVKEIGLFALAFGFLGAILGLFQVFDAIHSAENVIPQSVICGGLKVSLITIIYGAIIYLISLVIRIFQKPRM